MTEPIHDFTAKLRQPSLAPQVDAYVSWRRDLARARAEGRPDPPPPDAAPISINLDLTTACNYRCDHCIDWEILNTRHRHDDRILRSSVRAMRERGLRSVILIGGGEPTLYPGFAGFVRFLKDEGLAVAVVSNGSRGDRLCEIAEVLGEKDWVRLSLDAGSDALFRAMHRPVRSGLGLEEILDWVPRIKDRNPELRVGFSYIITWRGASRDDVGLHENIHEIALAAERARAHRFDYIAFKPVLERAPHGAEVMEPGRADALPEVISRIRAELDRARVLETDGFRVHVSTNLRVLEQGNWRDLCQQPRTCHMQALRQVLTPLGTYNCPAHRGVAVARLGEADLFVDGTNGAGPALARMLDDFDASRECREVTCLYNAVNWWIEKRVEDPREVPESPPGDESGDFFL